MRHVGGTFLHSFHFVFSRPPFFKVLGTFENNLYLKGEDTSMKILATSIFTGTVMEQIGCKSNQQIIKHLGNHYFFNSVFSHFLSHFPFLKLSFAKVYMQLRKKSAGVCPEFHQLVFPPPSRPADFSQTQEFRGMV